MRFGTQNTGAGGTVVLLRCGLVLVACGRRRGDRWVGQVCVCVCGVGMKVYRCAGLDSRGWG